MAQVTVSEKQIVLVDGTEATQVNVAFARGQKGADGFSPQINLTQDSATVATLTISYKDATTGQVTTKSATFGGTFVDGNGVSY